MKYSSSIAPFVPPDPDDLGGVFVSPAGAASNPGTREAPLDSPSRAAVIAARDNKAVFIAAGTYGDEVVASVSLFGGYSPDFGELDPERFRTEIIGAPNWPNRHSTTALTLAAGDVVVHGLTLRGGESTFAAALTIRTAVRATIVRNVLVGGGNGSLGGFTHSHGVDIRFGEKPVFTMIDNVIDGGSNNSCWGIDGLRDGCVIDGNTIVGGTSASASTYGIRGYGDFTLVNNTIDAGTGANAQGVILHGDRATITGNRITTRRGNWRDCLVVLEEKADPVISGNTLDGTPDEVRFAFVKKLASKSWRYNDHEGMDWSYDILTLNPWGWLMFSSDSATEPTGAGYQGPTQSFHEFLTSGPPPSITLPENIADEVRALLAAAGCSSTTC